MKKETETEKYLSVLLGVTVKDGLAWKLCLFESKTYVDGHQSVVVVV